MALIRSMLRKMLQNEKGDISGTAMMVVGVFATLAFGIYFMAILYDNLDINESNPFYTIFTGLPDDFGTIIGIVVVLVTIVILALAFLYFRGSFGGGSAGKQ